MKTDRRGWIGRVVSTTALVVIGTGWLAPAQANGWIANRAPKSPISIGQILSRTGPNATCGTVKCVPTLDGALLAVRQINKHGGVNGRPIKLIVVDDQSTVAGANAAFQQLVHIDHVSAVVGPSNSTQVQAITAAIEQARIPVMINGASYTTTHQGGHWVFRTRSNTIYQDRAEATFAVRTLHLSKIALLYVATLGGTVGALLRGDLKALGVTPVVDETYPVLAPDLTAQVLAIKKSGATGLIMAGGQPADYRLLARQMREVGVHLTWLGDFAMAIADLQPDGELLRGTYAVTDYVAAQSPEAVAFDRGMEASFHQHPGANEVSPYDGLKILARVMRKVGTSPRAIRRGILAIRGYRGALGTYNFDKHGDGLHQATIVKNIRGHLHVIRVLSF